MNKRRLIPLFTAFVLWGSQYVVSKVALRTIPPVTLLALRYLVSIPALLLVLRLRRALKPVDRRDWPILFAIGFTGYFASFCLQMLGIDRLTGSLSSLLGAMNPIFIPILAALFLHERITLSKIACVALSMLGVVVIVGVGGTADAAGVLMMLVMSVGRLASGVHWLTDVLGGVLLGTALTAAYAGVVARLDAAKTAKVD